MPQIGNKKYSYDAAGMAAYNRDKRIMQGGGQPPQTQMPPPQAAPQTQRPPDMRTPQTQQGRVNPMEKAMALIVEQNERLKQQLQMSKIQMQKMAMVMEGKTPPSDNRTQEGAKNTPKRRGGAVKKKRGGSCGSKMKRK